MNIFLHIVAKPAPPSDVIPNKWTISQTSKAADKRFHLCVTPGRVQLEQNVTTAGHQRVTYQQWCTCGGLSASNQFTRDAQQRANIRPSKRETS